MGNRVGQQLGNYLLTRLLGQGGFAEVYLGQHIYLKTEAAIKVLQAQVSGDDMQDFVNEARTIANLIHPNIVRVLEFGREGDAPFLVMDYAPHGTLRQRHPRGARLEPDIIIPYIRQISTGLQYAHTQKLIHRDIKPENLLVGRHDEILLSDFGIALVAQSSRYQSTQDVIGTVAYMSPEQIQGKPRPASDQYSLGIVVYEWLSGNRPFHGSFTELCTQHMFAPPPPLHERVPSISPDIEQVVTTALAKDPKERFATVQAFANALEQAGRTPLVEPTILARPPELTATVFVSPPLQPAFTATTPAIPSTPSPSIAPAPLATPPTPSTPSFSPPPALSETPLSSRARHITLVPFGLAAFAVSALLLGFYNTGLFSGFAILVDFAYFFAISGLVQIIAGIQELRTGNNFLATILCSYGAYWLSFGFTLLPLFSGYNLLTFISLSFRMSSTQALGIFLLSWTLFTGLMLLCALRSYRALIALFASVLLAFLLLALDELQGGNFSLFRASGWLEYLTAIIALITTWYVATHRTALEPALPNRMNPLLPGLSAFALTLFVVSLYNTGLYPGGGVFIGLGLFLFFGGLVEIIVGIQALMKGNALAATAFCANGGLWLVFGFVISPGFSGPSLISQSTNPSTIIGTLLLGWTIANVITLVLARKTNNALIATFFAASVTFLFLTIGAFGTSPGMTQLGGWLGLITALLAWYVLLALLLAEAKKPLRLPIGARV